MEQQNQYVLYGYLTFLWKKKWLILLATIIGMGLGYGYSSLQKVTYSSIANVYTGTAQNEELSKVALIKGKYKKMLPDDLKEGFNATIPDNNVISLHLVGSNDSKVKENIESVAKEFEEDLKENYSLQEQAIRDYYNFLDSQIKSPEGLLNDDYKNNLIKSLPESLNTNIVENILTMQLAYMEENFHQLDIQLSKLKEPYISEIIHNANKPSSLRYIVLGGAAFFQLMLIIVILWKYIINARQFKEMSE
ncbi:Wzz/FepE/Etk N-terminal domain-containing protein [Litchfieldia sinesaloumensis]|uniref:Wzz/FepE/Etk N-terminal domain-containing protein n=1 Tax=Litchfieldia sinesaloumensis TaxID=1926280 RepID=UPI0009883AA2|nr:Wzz/FepE/Etk N-terminal domain-containing protein [Bacillus sinesaloumensis]